MDAAVVVLLVLVAVIVAAIALHLIAIAASLRKITGTLNKVKGGVVAIKGQTDPVGEVIGGIAVRRIAAASSGVQTTYSPVTKPLTLAGVCARPVVWRIWATP